MAGVKSAKPMRSSLDGIVRINDMSLGFEIWSGMWINASIAATRPPKGRLM